MSKAILIAHRGLWILVSQDEDNPSINDVEIRKRVLVFRNHRLHMHSPPRIFLRLSHHLSDISWLLLIRFREDALGIFSTWKKKLPQRWSHCGPQLAR